MKSLSFVHRLVVILLPLCVGTACAAPSAREIARAIKQLGDDRFTVREQATAFLWRAGEAAEPALQTALKSGDPEVVQRAQRILERMQWGIFADTPAEVADLIRKYRNANRETRHQAVKQLLTWGGQGNRSLQRILANKEDPAHTDLVSWLQEDAELAVPSLAAEEKYDLLENLMELAAASRDPDAIRHYVACLMLRHRVEDRIATYQRQANGAEPKRIAELLACLYRARGDLAPAADWAEKADISEVTDSALYLARRWKTLAARHGGKAESEEALGFLLTYQRLAGQTDKLPATVAALRRIAANRKPDDGSIWRAATPLFLNDRTEEALAVLSRSPHQQMMAEILVAQLRLREARTLLESTARTKSASSFGAELRRAHLLNDLGEAQQARALARRLCQVPRHQRTPWDFRGLVDLLRYLGDTEAAFEQLVIWMETAPKELDSWAWTAVYPVRGDEAEAWWRVLRHRSPRDRPAQRVKAVRCMLEGDRGELASLIRVALPLSAKMAAYQKEYYLFALAKSCKAARRPDLFRECLEYAAVHTGSARAWRRLADAKASAKQWREAAADYQRAALADPKDPVYLALQGWALGQAGQVKEGERLQRRASWQALGNAEVRHELMEVCEERGLAGAARQHREMIYRLARTSAWQLGGALDAATEEAVAGNDYSRAADLFELSLLRVIHAGFFFSREESFVTGPHSIHWYRARGLLNAGKIDEALVEVRLCQKLLPGDLALPLSFVPALEKRGRHQEAEKLFTQVYRLHEDLCKEYPRWSEGYHRLAVLCSGCRRRLEEGQKYAEKAVALAPRNALYLATLAEIHFQRGGAHKAVELMTRCRELEPANAAYQQKLERFEKAQSRTLAFAPAPRPAPPRPPRILLFVGTPSREYQFLRSILLRRSEKGEVDLSIHLQKSLPRISADVPSDRILEQFPTRLVPGEKADAKDPESNLARYDVLIAVDPDWTLLSEKQVQLVAKWAGARGHGLILVAGPASVDSLGRPANARKLGPILDILPVQIGDSPRKRDADTPCRLGFPVAAKFLSLEGDKEPALAGWAHFFFGEEHRNDWQKTGDRPLRGFHSCAPVKAVKPTATVLAVFHDPDAPARARDVPYVVTMSCGKGRAVFLGSGESWRLRAFREEYHERFWAQLIRHAVPSAPPLREIPGAR